MKPNFNDITYLRVCLFDNATNEQLILNKSSYKLTVGAKKASSDRFMNFTFGMNTKGIWVLNRSNSLDKEILQDTHYQQVKDRYNLIRQSGNFDDHCAPRISKAYMAVPPRGRTSIPYVTAILWSQQQQYHINLLMGDTEWSLSLDRLGLTTRERTSGMIAKTIWRQAENSTFDWSTTGWV